MSTTWQIVLAILGTLGTITGGISFIALFKQNKRIKTAEADKGEIYNLKSIIQGLERSRDEMQKEIDDLKRQYNLSEKDKIIIEAQNNKYQRAINCVDLCETEKDKCPIVIKLNELTNEKT